MKLKPPSSFSVAKVFCRIFGHRLKISKKVTNHIREYQCEYCGMEMTDTAHGACFTAYPQVQRN